MNDKIWERLAKYIRATNEKYAYEVEVTPGYGPKPATYKELSLDEVLEMARADYEQKPQSFWKRHEREEASRLASYIGYNQPARRR